MIGTELESNPRPPLGAILWLTGAVLLLGLSVGLGAGTANPHPAIGAILPAVVGVSLWFARPRPFRATVTEEGLLLGSPDDPDQSARRLVAYEDIQGLMGVGRHRQAHIPGRGAYEIRLTDPAGPVRIPKRLNVPADDLYRFLSERVPDQGSRVVHESLSDFLRREVDEYGPERVWTYGAASHVIGGGSTRRGWRVFGLAFLVVGLIWLAIGLAYASGGRGGDPGRNPGVAWAGGGGLLLFLSLLFLIAGYAGNADRPLMVGKRWRESSLVVSPRGLALAQGDIQGEIGWDQVRDVKLRGQPRHLSFTITNASNLSGILLKIAGADVLIADIYDRPLQVIYERIEACRRGEVSADPI